MIKLLLDANLSYRLVKKLKEKYPDSIQVTRTGLPNPAKDIEIWNWAKINDYLIVTNDEDFEHLLNQHQFPQKVILLRTGNQTTKIISQVLLKLYKEIKNFVILDDLGLLEIL